MTTTRIAILGPESSGKTTLATFLVEQFDSFLIEEYARSYLNERNGKYNIQDLDCIATRQFELNDQLTDKPYLIADTELLTIKIWSEVKYKTVSSKIQELLQKQKFDLYLLCKPDLPWEEDPLREHPQFRDELFRMYEFALQELNWNFSIIEGSNRNSKAIELIKKL